MDDLLPRPRRVRRVVVETHDTVTLEIDADGDGRFQPGQFNMLYAFGVGEVAISLSGDPSRPATMVHTTREAGAVTRALCRLRRGTMLGVRGPYGRPWPLAEAVGKDVVIVAGGIGLAPLRPVLHRIAARRREFGAVSLVYGARAPEDVLYRRDLERWQTCDIAVVLTVDRGTRSWPGHVGVVTTLLPRTAFEPTNAVAFVCGPEIMMRFAADALAKRGVPAERVHVSLERNMKCAVGTCGHCQLGPAFVCKDGPVLPYARVRRLLAVREL